jgi:hypothetical protein
VTIWHVVLGCAQIWVARINASDRWSLAISGPQHAWSLKKVERVGENNRGFLRRYVSARDTHRAQKQGGIKPLFTAPIYVHALSQADKWPLHNHPTDSMSPTPSLLLSVTSLTPLSFPHTYPPLTIPPVTSPLSSPCHLSSLCPPSSQPPCLLHLAIAHRVACHLPIIRQTLIHPLPSHPCKHPTQLQVAECRGCHVSQVQC